MDVLDNTIRQQYLQDILESNDTDTANRILKGSADDPIYYPRGIQPEEEPSYNNVSDNVAESIMDIANLDHNINLSSQEYQALKENMDERLTDIQERLNYEKELLQDTNMICGNISEFTNVKPLNSSVFTGAFYTENDGETFSCPHSETELLSYSIEDVSGNGRAGNENVKEPEGANISKIDTSQDKLLYDQNLSTAWEYERLETFDKDRAKNGAIYYDTDPVRCTIILYTRLQATQIKINTEDPYLILEDVRVSVDGDYYTSAIREELEFNNKEAIYNNYQYIYGSGVIAFSPSNYIKLTFRSNIVTDDIIVDDSNAVLDAVKRKVISIRQIELYNNDYTYATMESNEIIQSGALQSLAVFANVYVPPNFPSTSNYVLFYLTVNGTDYPIVPINGNDTGTKIIRYNTSPSYISRYSLYINTPITSAKLKIKMKPYNDIQTPFVSHIKLCVGKEGTVRV